MYMYIFFNKTYQFRGDLAVIYFLLLFFLVGEGGGGKEGMMTASTNLKGLYAFL